jgi:hypothetical protein
MKKLFLCFAILGLSGCTSTADYAMAVDDKTIYYNECFDVLNIWHKCELKSQKTDGKPVMQRVQTVIANDKFIKNEF